MDRATGRELELRNLLREIDQLDVKAQLLQNQARQLHLNSLAKLDARDWYVSATESRLAADNLVREGDAMERRVKDSARGAYSGASSTIPGLVGTLKDRATRLAKNLRGIHKEIERLHREVSDKMHDPLRHSAGASLGMPAADLMANVHSLISMVQKIIFFLQAI
jgi:hypothetical protein